MNISCSREFDAEVPVVVRIMQSEELQHQKAKRLGAIDFSYDRTEATKTIVTSRRVLPTGQLPEFLKALVTPTMTVIETEVWDPADGGGQSGTFDINVQGAPVEHRGTVEVARTPAGCRVTFAGEWLATVPLFRANVEESSAQTLHETIETEFRLIAEHIALAGE